jgi:hypothetical protein
MILEEVSSDITAMIKFTTNIKMNNAKIQSLTKKIDEDTKAITEAVNLNNNKLRSAVE